MKNQTVIGKKRPKRHKWSRGNGWCYCTVCGCRYKTGNFNREYEFSDGTRSGSARECKP